MTCSGWRIKVLVCWLDALRQSRASDLDRSAKSEMNMFCRVRTVLLAVGCSLSQLGCQNQSTKPTPILSGQLLGVTLWERPVQRPGETGSNSGTTLKEGHLDVYDQFIVVTLPDGKRMLSTHGWYSGLTFK